KPGDNHQAVARNFQINVLEVVLARALDDDLVRHKLSRPQRLPSFNRADRIFERGQHARVTGCSVARDFECGSMVGRGADEWQTQRNVDGAIELESLERDQALVVIHRDGRIEPEAALLLNECSVGRERAESVDSLALRRSNGRSNETTFLVSEQ